jgi:Flp pilus assembly protein TadD
MSGANVSPGRFRWRRIAQILFVLAVIGVVVWQARVHASAWEHLKQGRAALARDDPQDARRHLEQVVETWPRRAEAHLLLARAARQLGDLDAARKHLKDAERLGHAQPDIELESDLIRAQSGYLAEVEFALAKHVHDGHRESPQIIAVLLPTYLADFRLSEAERLAARWVELRPESARAWTYRADILERLRRKHEAVDALRHLVTLDPDDRRARLNLARVLLELRQAPDEAAGHVEWLTTTDPNNPALLIQLAACREALGRVDEAAGILDRVIASPTRDAKALHYRGRLEMNRGRPAAAAPFLHQAAEVDPSDPEILYTLFQCVQQTGTPNEIRAAEERWQRCEADLKRVGELARTISASPQDPDLRREIGELFLRNGRTQEGLRWLESALRIRPDHAPTHRVLASHYQRTGRADLAAYHNSLAARKPEPDPNKK